MNQAIATYDTTSENCKEAYPFGFNGQERKDDYKGKGNHNHALYWEYDTRIGRRWNLDPVDQINISNYATMANSPIWKNDPLGDEVKGDKQAYKEVKDQVNFKIVDLNSDIAGVKGKIAENAAAGTSVKRLEKQLTKLEAAKAVYQGVLNEYTELENSSQVYNIVNGGKVPEGAGGETRFNKTTGDIDVVIGHDRDVIDNLPHELMHAYQFEKGKISFDYNTGNAGGLRDLQDEIEAYQRGQLFGSDPGQTIDLSWVRLNKGYSGGGNQISIATMVSKNPDVTMGDQIKASIYGAGRRDHPPTEVIKDWKIYYNQGKNRLPLMK